VTEEELQANHVPVLAMVGSKDGLRPSAEELGKRMMNCELVVIEGGGHMNTTGKPAFLEKLQAFLAKHAPERIESSLMMRPCSIGVPGASAYDAAFFPSRVKPERIGV
jgi:hypothetical protein